VDAWNLPRDNFKVTHDSLDNLNLISGRLYPDCVWGAVAFYLMKIKCHYEQYHSLLFPRTIMLAALSCLSMDTVSAFCLHASEIFPSRFNNNTKLTSWLAFMFLVRMSSFHTSPRVCVKLLKLTTGKCLKNIFIIDNTFFQIIVCSSLRIVYYNFRN
jgi:hypothetical protein